MFLDKDRFLTLSKKPKNGKMEKWRIEQVGHIFFKISRGSKLIYRVAKYLDIVNNDLVSKIIIGALFMLEWTV